MQFELSDEQRLHRDAACRSYAKRHPARSLDFDATLPTMFAAVGEATDWREHVLRQGREQMRGDSQLAEFPALADWARAGVLSIGAWLKSAKGTAGVPAFAEQFNAYELEKTLDALDPTTPVTLNAALRAAHAIERARRNGEGLEGDTLQAIVAPYRATRGELPEDALPPSDFALMGEVLSVYAVFMATPVAERAAHREQDRSTTAFVKAVQRLYQEEGLGEPMIDDYVDIWMYMTATGPRAKLYRAVHGRLTKRGVVQPRRTARGARKPGSPSLRE